MRNGLTVRTERKIFIRNKGVIRCERKENREKNIDCVAPFDCHNSRCYHRILQSKGNLTNQFDVGKVSAKIEENFDGQVKSDVRVTNTGNMPVYVRCNLSVYYETSKGKEQDSEAETKTDNISINVPKKDEDYTLQFPDGFKDNWLEIDGIYYYRKPLQNGESVQFIKNCKEVKKKDGEKLVVDISTQSIQAEPERAVSDAWKKVVVDSETKELKEAVRNENK